MLHVIYVIIDTCEQARCARPIFQNAGQTGSDTLSQEVLWSFKDSTVNRKKRIEFQVNAELLCFMDSRPFHVFPRLHCMVNAESPPLRGSLRPFTSLPFANPYLELATRRDAGCRYAMTGPAATIYNGIRCEIFSYSAARGSWHMSS